MTGWLDQETYDKIISSHTSYTNAQQKAANAADAGTQVRCLGREDPLEKEMATHFTILAWKIP